MTSIKIKVYLKPRGLNIEWNRFGTDLRASLSRNVGKSVSDLVASGLCLLIRIVL